MLSPIINKKVWMITLNTSCHHKEKAGKCNKRRKECKRYNNLWGEMKLRWFMEDIIVYVENFKELTKEILELMCPLSKISGKKINMPKSIVFPYLNNKQLQFNVHNMLFQNEIFWYKSTKFVDDALKSHCLSLHSSAIISIFFGSLWRNFWILKL